MAFVRKIVLPLLFMIVAVGVRAQQLVNAYPNLLFSKPVYLTSCGDGGDRVFVVQQTGIIAVFPNDSTAASSKTFLDVSLRLSSSGGEEGLLGLAFHPDYAQNGYFYIDYTAPNPLRTVVARYKVRADDPDTADPSSEFKIIEIPQPFTNHNGGMLAFGPDGYLYIGMGDGGSGGDPQNNAQDRTKLLGKILRLDVNDTTATTHYVIPPDNPYANDTGGLKKEIWAYGLRNPWRFSFDTATGALWAGDVGQDAVEEIDIIRDGRNYGWRIMEGTHCYNPPTACDTTGLTPPIKEYLHPAGEAITGGYIYHGLRRPDLGGAYIYADYVVGKIWVLRYENGLVTADSLLMQMSTSISSFGIDRDQELYVVTYSSSGSPTGIYRFSGSRVPGTPRSFVLHQNRPNPFSEATSIPFGLKHSAAVSLRIFDAAGRLVRTLVNGERPAGTYRETWDGMDSSGTAAASGIYFCRFDAGGYRRTIKIVLLR